jgi:hypothetical protein
VIPAHARIIQTDIDAHSRSRALAFLLRKATVLLDLSTPDRGTRDVIVLNAEPDTTLVPATALATILSRSGFRLLLPIIDARDSATVFALSALGTSAPVILVTPGPESALLDGLHRLLPEMSCFRWWHESAEHPDDDHWLPSPILDVPGALPDPV